MSKFKKSGNKGMPAISTASLPDIVFMLLFFFMVTTVMRETTLFVSVVTPKATEIKKMEKKSLVSYIYVGKPIKRLRTSDNELPKIQLNDAFSSVKDIQTFIATERDAKDERNYLYKKYLDLDNLFPICSLCNKSMGTTSIDDWSKLRKDKRKWYTGLCFGKPQ